MIIKYKDCTLDIDITHYDPGVGDSCAGPPEMCSEGYPLELEFEIETVTTNYDFQGKLWQSLNPDQKEEYNDLEVVACRLRKCPTDEETEELTTLILNKMQE